MTPIQDCALNQANYHFVQIKKTVRLYEWLCECIFLLINTKISFQQDIKQFKKNLHR